ncbi:uncharacterized protein LOC143247091 [Tachypleus tridentatus]|uniref:uncharacterized protein LOC143247091 n=1 Tax=Tachypleus tridentatus TaxID=6853 RepID=UPI003FD1B9CB
MRNIKEYGELSFRETSVTSNIVLKVSPPEELTFSPGSISEVKVTNLGQKPVAYKVRMISKNLVAYHCVPVSDILDVNRTGRISVELLQGYMPSSSDAFLFSAVELDHTELSPEKVANKWKYCDPEHIMHHRMSCVTRRAGSVITDDKKLARQYQNVMVGQLEKKARRISMLHTVQFVVFIFLVLLILVLTYKIRPLFQIIHDLEEHCNKSGFPWLCP